MYTRNDVLTDKFGVDSRINQLQEECAELICIANHYRRGRVTTDKVAEEIADVRVSMEQVMRKLGISDDDVNNIAQYKVYRALSRREWEKNP